MTDADTSIQLVRHAKAQSRNKWWGKRDRDRPLTKIGWAQSKSLAVELAARPVVRILTSPFTRCVETVQPLADRLDIVMCSHGDVIPSVMAALAGRDGLDIDDVHLRKGARFQLTFKGPKCVAVEAVVPP
jgi:broad specificity phosphatase PhoE